MSLRNVSGNDASGTGNSSVQSPTHRGVHRSISASSTKPNRRASSGAETLRKFNHFHFIHQNKTKKRLKNTRNQHLFLGVV